MNRHCAHLGVLLASLSFLSTVSADAADPPEITALEPSVLRPGTTQLVTVRGRNLAALHTVWTTWLGPQPIVAPSEIPTASAAGAESHPQETTLDLAVPSGFPLGIEMIRVIGDHGVSNPFLLLVDDLSIPDPPVQPAHELEHAPILQPPVAVDAWCRPSKVDLYRLPAADREVRLSVEVVAHRLGSPMDPVLRLLDPTGQELLYVHDTGLEAPDCTARIRVPAGRGCFLEVRDAEFGGGRDVRYRLRIGDFPVSPVPAISATGRVAPASVPWTSASGPSGFATVAAPVFSSTPTVRLRITSDTGAAAPSARMAFLEPDVARESEPNNTLSLATPLPAHRPVSAAFESTDDADWFRIVVPEPGLWRFRALSRRLGFPCDPWLRLVDENGRTVASADPTKPEANLWHRFQAPGIHFLALSELANRTGPERRYLLSAESQASPFSFSSESDRIQVPVGGSATVKLVFERHGYDGPIQLSARGIDSGLTLQNPVVAEGKKEWDLEIRGETGLRPGTWGQMRLLAWPVKEVDTRPAVLDLQPSVRKLFPRLPSAPSGFIEDLFYCVVAAAESS